MIHQVAPKAATNARFRACVQQLDPWLSDLYTRSDLAGMKRTYWRRSSSLTTIKRRLPGMSDRLVLAHYNDLRVERVLCNFDWIEHTDCLLELFERELKARRFEDPSLLAQWEKGLLS